MYGRPYTHEQDKWLNDNVPVYGNAELTEKYNERFNDTRSVSAIKNRIHFLLCEPRHIRYTEEEEQWIRDNFFLDRKTMARKFKERFGYERTLRSIEYKCHSLGAIKEITVTKEEKLRRVWTEEMDEWLLSNWREYRHRFPEMMKQMNLMFDKSLNARSVYMRCYHLGITLTKYSDDEMAWLLENHFRGEEELALLFNKKFNERRDGHALKVKANKLKNGIMQGFVYNAQKTASDGLLAENGETIPTNDCERSEEVL